MQHDRQRHDSRRCGVTRHAVIHLEVLVSIGFTVVLATLFSVAVLQYASARRANDTRRLLQFAASTELDRIRAGVHAVPVGQGYPPLTLAAGQVDVTTTATLGEGPWRGLTCVHVTASQRLGPRRTVAVELSAYVATEARP